MASLIGKRVLIVDDEEGIREIWTVECKFLGASVVSAENGAVAFEIFCREKIDLVITDIRMPKSDGLELLKKIKATGENSPPVFLVTGYADITENEAKALGAAALIQKPCDIEAVLRGIVDSVRGEIVSG
jgi:CheY-like chemotaxis protein